MNDETPGSTAAAGRATSPSPAPGGPSDEEYARATSPRNIAARARGLPRPYIPGGEDPDPERTAREERTLRRLLVAMVLTIVLGGFALSILALILMSNR